MQKERSVKKVNSHLWDFVGYFKKKGRFQYEVKERYQSQRSLSFEINLKSRHAPVWKD